MQAASPENAAPVYVSPCPKIDPVPDHVAILGLGSSLEAYTDHVRRLGGRRRFADEVWAINALGDILQCDRVFHMDDVRVQEIRAAARPESNIAVMLGWLKTHPGPIYTSFPHPDYPGTVAYPLEEVINSAGIEYLNNTAAHAVAYAIHIGVKKISLFGCDYTYPNAHDAERGRGCLEFHLGRAHAMGILVALPDRTSLMDAMLPRSDRIYGYDAADIDLEEGPGGETKVTFTARPLPTADEIEARYDHSRHPNALVQSST